MANEEMSLSVVYDEPNSRSLAYVGEEVAGECDYELIEGKWHILHTVVRPEFGGRGIARKLVEKIIEKAREKGVKIVPVCSYAAKMMLSNEEYKDVL